MRMMLITFFAKLQSQCIPHTFVEAYNATENMISINAVGLAAQMMNILYSLYQ